MTNKIFLLSITLIHLPIISSEINLPIISSDKNFDLQAFIEKEVRRSAPATQIHNHIYTSSTAQNQSNPSIQTIKMNEENDTDYLKKLEKALESFYEKKEAVKLHLIEHKWIIGACGLSFFYLYTWNQINQINKILNNPSSWHLFKEEIPLARLKTINRADLFKELQLAVCKKYISPCQPDSSQKVMIKFLEEISLEKAALEKYIQYQQVISSCYLSKIFPTLKKPEQIEEAIARINFLIDLYIEFFVIK